MNTRHIQYTYADQIHTNPFPATYWDSASPIRLGRAVDLQDEWYLAFHGHLLVSSQTEGVECGLYHLFCNLIELYVLIERQYTAQMRRLIYRGGSPMHNPLLRTRLFYFREEIDLRVVQEVVDNVQERSPTCINLRYEIGVAWGQGLLP